ncbi:MAG: extracellular solute-binding protein [Propionibacteriaceae bacterium]|nr:extracellular solute-binding protein [Propionibacteriaceae bacterium]
MKMHRVSAMALAAGLALTLAACGGGNTPAPANTAGGGTTAGGGEKAKIVVDMWAGSEDDTAALNAQLDVVKRDNPDIEVELRTAPWGDFFTKLTTNMASNNMACVTGMNSGMLSSYTAGFDVLTPESLATAGLAESDFAEGSLEILKNKGELYGLPFDVATMLTYYNEDQLTAAGATIPKVGWTFADFEAAAKAATKDGKYGFGIGMGGFQWQALPIAKGGVQPVTQDGQLQLTNADFVAAAEWYAGLVTEQKIAAPVASASDTGWGENQFTGENAAMAVDGTWNAVGYLNNDAGFKAGLVPLPSGDKGNLSLILGSGYGIAKNCDNKEAALKVLGSLLSKDAQDSIASSGRSYPARAESQPLYFESLDESVRDQVKTTFEAAFSNVQGQYVSDNWSKVDTFVQPELVSIYNGQADMATVLETAQQQFGQ